MYIITTDKAEDLLSKAQEPGASIHVSRIPVGLPTLQGFHPALGIQYWVNEGQQAWTYVETATADESCRVHLGASLLGRISEAGLGTRVTLIRTSGSV